MTLYRAEADVCDAFISFLEDSWTFESSHIQQKQKQVKYGAFLNVSLGSFFFLSGKKVLPR